MKKSKSIFKPGAKLKVRKVDINSPEVKEQIRRVQEEQKRILERKNFDVREHNIIIDI